MIDCHINTPFVQILDLRMIYAKIKDSNLLYHEVTFLRI